MVFLAFSLLFYPLRCGEKKIRMEDSSQGHDEELEPGKTIMGVLA